MDEKMLLEMVDKRIQNYQNELSKFMHIPAQMFNLLQKGKRFRSRFLLGNKAIESDETKVRYATYIELLHAASLVHDDIIDQSSTRRGFPTLNSLFPINIPLSSGFYLFSRILLELTKESPSVYNAFCNTLRQMTLGQIYEIEPHIESIHSYIQVISLKTASLFALACGLESNSFSYEKAKIGHYYGIAFQITDDTLDFSGNEELLGKNVHLDEIIGVQTLPLMLRNKGLEKTEIIEKCKNIINHYLNKCKALDSKLNLFEKEFNLLANYTSNI
jgi:geranylgeranyl pyrophosphate synthase